MEDNNIWTKRKMRNIFGLLAILLYWTNWRGFGRAMIPLDEEQDIASGQWKNNRGDLLEHSKFCPFKYLFIGMLLQAKLSESKLKEKVTCKKLSRKKDPYKLALVCDNSTKVSLDLGEELAFLSDELRRLLQTTNQDDERLTTSNTELVENIKSVGNLISTNVVGGRLKDDWLMKKQLKSGIQVSRSTEAVYLPDNIPVDDELYDNVETSTRLINITPVFPMSMIKAFLSLMGALYKTTPQFTNDTITGYNVVTDLSQSPSSHHVTDGVGVIDTEGIQVTDEYNRITATGNRYHSTSTVVGDLSADGGMDLSSSGLEERFPNTTDLTYQQYEPLTTLTFTENTTYDENMTYPVIPTLSSYFGEVQATIAGTDSIVERLTQNDCSTIRLSTNCTPSESIMKTDKLRLYFLRNRKPKKNSKISEDINNTINNTGFNIQQGSKSNHTGIIQGFLDRVSFWDKTTADVRTALTPVQRTSDVPMEVTLPYSISNLQRYTDNSTTQTYLLSRIPCVNKDPSVVTGDGSLTDCTVSRLLNANTENKSESNDWDRCKHVKDYLDLNQTSALTTQTLTTQEVINFQYDIPEYRNIVRNKSYHDYFNLLRDDLESLNNILENRFYEHFKTNSS